MMYFIFAIVTKQFYDAILQEECAHNASIIIEEVRSCWGDTKVFETWSKDTVCSFE